jgi:acetoin utilization deacetylase AcuC-like enzyme
MTSPTGFVMHEDSALHDTGWNHPEHQGRLRALTAAVTRDLPLLHDRVVQVAARAATEAELLRAHTEEHLERIRVATRTAEEEGRLVFMEQDTPLGAATLAAAVGSAGAAITAAEGVALGTFRNAFVACRPPGHHATPDRAMGFCFFNSVAVAARWLQDRGHAERVLIVDWDVHHGNGTQDIFYRDGSVFFLSLHQAPFYPGTGAERERGEGEGEGTTLNIPLPAGTPRESYLRIFREALDRVTGVFEPDFILVSCGFDVLAGDPLGGQLLEPEDLHEMTRATMDRAEEKCGGRLVLLLEGGYDPDRTGAGTVAALRALAGFAPSGSDEE